VLLDAVERTSTSCVLSISVAEVCVSRFNYLNALRGDLKRAHSCENDRAELLLHSELRGAFFCSPWWSCTCVLKKRSAVGWKSSIFSLLHPQATRGNLRLCEKQIQSSSFKLLTMLGLGKLDKALAKRINIIGQSMNFLLRNYTSLKPKIMLVFPYIKNLNVLTRLKTMISKHEISETEIKRGTHYGTKICKL
jgi:hypothetical protein